jgi:hypothetical protein
MYAFLISPMHATCPVHIIHFIAWIIFEADYHHLNNFKLHIWSFLRCWGSLKCLLPTSLCWNIDVSLSNNLIQHLIPKNLHRYFIGKVHWSWRAWTGNPLCAVKWYWMIL